jgi:tRNA(Ile)-lysidine synthase
VRARARREKGSLEQVARAERYAFLRRAKDETGAAAIAVAHTEDDQAETFLLRLLRGAGGAGLQAMRPRSGDVIRPLLGVPRADVLAHLRARGLAWREDETNHDTAFARNRVRHELIPYLERHFNPRLRPALARAAELLAAEQSLLEGLVAPPAPDASGAVALPLGELRTAPAALARLRVRRALEATGGLRGVSERHVRRILELAGREAASGRFVTLPGGRRAGISFERLRIGPSPRPGARFAFPLAVPGRVELPGGLALVAEPAPAPAVSEVVGAVVGVPKGPLEVRTRRAGDRVHVRGRARSLKRYLIDQRVPADERGRLPLVAVGREVLWLPERPLSGAGDRYVRLRLEPA